MNLSWDNPVARHAGRLASRGWIGALGLLLVGSGLLGALLQRYGMELEIYDSPSRHQLARWLATTLIAEMVIVVPWATVRGALIWARLARDGSLDEYRRSRLSGGAITAGALAAALAPVAVLIGVSLAVALVAGGALRAYSLAGAVGAHGLLLVQAAAYGLLGVWLAGRVRYPSLAVPLALIVFAATVAAIWAVDRWLAKVRDPGGLIYQALLVNPVTATASLLETDILRFSWLYRHVHAHEYFYVYPPVWQTALVYTCGAVLLSALVSRRIARER